MSISNGLALNALYSITTLRDSILSQFPAKLLECVASAQFANAVLMAYEMDFISVVAIGIFIPLALVFMAFGTCLLAGESYLKRQ